MRLTFMEAAGATTVSKYLLEHGGRRLLAAGGRVVHRLKAFASARSNTILLAGYQAAGTRGVSLAGGARKIKIHGEHVPVRDEVVSLGSLSTHADLREPLGWLDRLPDTTRRFFVTHGEAAAADALRRHIRERQRWTCTVAEHLASVEP
jgi:metallo-beta-lactamase family protein